MTFEWDSQKDELNRKKHNGISFSMAAKVFLDSHVIVKYDSKHSTMDEERWQAIGRVENILFVVFTERKQDVIRIISPRRATQEEIDEYYRHYES